MQMLWLQSVLALVGLASASGIEAKIRGFRPAVPVVRGLADDLLDGTWRSYFEGYPVRLEIQETATGYSGYFKLLNSVQYEMESQTDGTVVTTLGASTRMAGPPEMMEAENSLNVFMSAVTEVALGADVVLELTGEEGTMRFRSNDLQWLDDGSDLTRSEGRTVFVDEIPYLGDTKVNAQYTDAVDSSTHYWEVEVDSPRMSFGLTSKQSFGPKYKIKGYFYNGNLSDGSGGLLIGFGPSLQPGDRVGMLVEFTDTMKVWFYVNDEPLGLAFNVALPPVPVYPTVSFKTGWAAATISRQPIPPHRNAADPTGVDGKWSGSFEGYPVRVVIEETPEGYSGTLKLLNYVQFTMVRQSDDTFITTLGASTLMAGTPEIMEAEQNFNSFMTSVTEINLSDDNVLELTGQMTTVALHPESPPTPVSEVVITE